ncbi:unnamed protein product [Closterium sp. NIES-54]
MESRRLRFDAEGRPIERPCLPTPPNDPEPTPAAQVDYDRRVLARDVWDSRDAATALALTELLPQNEAAHFAQVETAQGIWDAVVARYSTPSSASLSRLLMSFVFPDLGSFATVSDLVTHLRSLDAGFRAACTDAQLLVAPPPMWLTVHWLVTRLPDCLTTARDVLLQKHPTELTIDLLETALGKIESNLLSVASATNAVPPPSFCGKRGKSGKKGGKGGGGGGGGGGRAGSGGGGGGGGGAPGGGSLGGGAGQTGPPTGGVQNGGRVGPQQQHQPQQGQQQQQAPQQLQPWGPPLQWGPQQHWGPPPHRGTQLYHPPVACGPLWCLARPPHPLVHSELGGCWIPLGQGDYRYLCGGWADCSLSLRPPRFLRLRQLLTPARKLRPLLLSRLLRVFPSLPPSPAPPCTPCVASRLRATPHSSSLHSSTAPFQSLHLDVWGPAPTQGPARERYFLVVVDDFSRYTTVFPLAKKSEVTSTLIRWLLATEGTHGRRVSCLQFDCGGEFRSDILAGLYGEQGIVQSWTLPESPQQNGVDERRIGLVMDITRTSMIHARAPHFLWTYAVRYAAHQLNLQRRVLRPEASPTSLWTEPPGVGSTFHVWGCLALVRDTSADKLSARAVPCVFLGFPSPQQPLVLPRQVTVDSVGVGAGGVASGGTRSGGARSRGAGVGGAGLGGDSPGGAGAGGPGTGGASSGGAGAGGAGTGGASSGGAGAGGAGMGGASSGGAGVGGPGTGGAWTGGAGAGNPDPVGTPSGDTGYGGGLPACAQGAGAVGVGAAGVAAVGPAGAATETAAAAVAATAAAAAATVAAAAPSGAAVVPAFHSSPPPSSLPVSPTPISNYYHAVRLVVSRILATGVTDPHFSPSSVSALTAAVANFVAANRLDYSTRVVPAPPTRPLSVGDPNALDIPTPRAYREAVSGPWASQWKVAMDSELASWRSTDTYVNAVPPPRANLVDGMWLFKVKRPPGSPPVFKARYVARDFNQREEVDFFQTFSPTPKMATLRVLLHIAAQRDYELHSLDFSTAFL